jgi:hypothetical protein
MGSSRPGMEGGRRGGGERVYSGRLSEMDRYIDD